MRCRFFGHEPLKLDVLHNDPLIAIGDVSGNLVDVQMCIRCRLLYWEVSYGVNKQGRQATVQQDSVCWN